MLAAELALSLLEGDELRAAQARLRRDPGFADLVTLWQERLVAMTDDIAAVAPARRVKKKLMKRLFPAPRVPLSQRLWVWKGIAFAAMAFAAYLGVQQLARLPQTDPGAVFATQMTAQTVPLQVLAVLDPARGDVAFSRVVGQEPQGRSFEVWAILPGAAPVSLGVLPQAPTLRVQLPEQMLIRAAELTFAISDEPAGGSPTGSPTGDILAASPVIEL